MLKVQIIPVVEILTFKATFSKYKFNVFLTRLAPRSENFSPGCPFFLPLQKTSSNYNLTRVIWLPLYTLLFNICITQSLKWLCRVYHVIPFVSQMKWNGSVRHHCLRCLEMASVLDRE